jgi:hypothetical protein
MKIEVIPEKKEYENFLDFYPPQLANRFLPDWYKNSSKLKNRYDHFLHEIHKDNPPMSVKNCPAIVDAITTGIILPLWGNFDFATFKDEESSEKIQHWDFSGRFINNSNIEEFVQYHSEDQFENMPIKKLADGRILKIKCPFKFIVPEGYNIYYTDPFYSYRRSIRLLSGVVEADRWGFITFPFEVLEDSFRINAGEPFVHLFIYKREKDKINLTLRNGTDDEYADVKKQHQEMFISQKNYKSLKTQ